MDLDYRVAFKVIYFVSSVSRSYIKFLLLSTLLVIMYRSTVCILLMSFDITSCYTKCFVLFGLWIV